MLVFWKQRLVILATPKTGSTAIETALESLSVMTLTRPPELKHTPAYRYQRFIRPYLRAAAGADFTAVALIREPIDWLGSWYRFRQRDDVADMANSTSEMDFAAFVRAYMSDPRPAFAEVGRQAKFLSGMNDAPLGIDLLFRFEQIERFIAYLEDRLDFPLELPRVNVSPPGDLALPESLQDELRRYLAPEYALYDSIV
ncbi:MAG: sulfotransferase family 2 domain-containing protein [Pararhodobacter sp.]|nr:sulfotransferase family 2 domain-containing protein [Pararhodobacter sp.]